MEIGIGLAIKMSLKMAVSHTVVLKSIPWSSSQLQLPTNTGPEMQQGGSSIPVLEELHYISSHGHWNLGSEPEDGTSLSLLPSCTSASEFSITHTQKSMKYT